MNQVLLPTNLEKVLAPYKSEDSRLESEILSLENQLNPVRNPRLQPLDADNYHEQIRELLIAQTENDLEIISKELKFIDQEISANGYTEEPERKYYLWAKEIDYMLNIESLKEIQNNSKRK